MTRRSFFLVLLVVAVLVGMYFLPQVSVLGHRLRQVNILSDVLLVDTTVYLQENFEEQLPEYVSYADSIPDGMVPIEDFRDSLGIHREMDAFYAALHQTQKRMVRIAYFGDSFIEGDILTAHIRELLQEKFGGCGVGFIDIMSSIAGFRTTVVEYSSGWTEYNAVSHRDSFNKQLQGIGGRYYLPMNSAHIQVRGQHRVFPEHLDTVQVATVYFTPEQGLEMQYSINKHDMKPLCAYSDSVDSGTETATHDSVEVISPRIEAATVRGKIGSIKVEVNGRGRFYGLALEGTKGIVLDNFSMRGSSGWHLGAIPIDVLKQFAELRHYDLIIMHFGLNTATAGTHRYTAYCNRFRQGIDNFKKAFPDASILVFSMSNRDARGTDGQFRTMDGVTQLVAAQREMAKSEHVAFWNLQQGMGGSGSMERLQKEGRANRDYTHINFRGGEVIGKVFFDVLMNGKMNYDRRVKLNPEHYRRSEVKTFEESK